MLSTHQPQLSPKKDNLPLYLPTLTPAYHTHAHTLHTHLCANVLLAPSFLLIIPSSKSSSSLSSSLYPRSFLFHSLPSLSLPSLVISLHMPSPISSASTHMLYLLYHMFTVSLCYNYLWHSVP